MKNPSLDICSLRLQVVNWQAGWGLKNLWEREFSMDLHVAQEDGQAAVDKFFETCEHHAKAGRQILRDLRDVALDSHISSTTEVRDMFLQIYDMILAVASEVKFFEVKLDEFAPAVTMMNVSDIRFYSGM